MKKNTVSAFILLSIGLMSGFTATAQSTPELRAKIVSQYDQAEVSKVLTELKEYNESNYKKTLELAKVNGWPLKMRSEKGDLIYLFGVTPYNEPIYKGFDNNLGPFSSAITARVAPIRTGGSMGLNLDGQGMTIGLWEIGGCLTTHEQLIGKVTNKDGVSFNGSNEDALESSGHATHVAGTLAGSGNGDAGAMGLAPQASIIAYDANQDDAEALSAANNPNIALLISNHSYGVYLENAPSWMPGAYSDESRAWDLVLHAAPYYQAVISAGNDRVAEENDLLIGNKTSKNTIVVAAVEGVANYNSPNDVDMSDFSSYGPTDDRRIKPDISMKGVNVYSAYPSGNAGSSSFGSGYAQLQGTSMASPGVAGTLTLLQQHYIELNDMPMRAATLKALMINSADEAGANPGPDQKFGWGLINAQRAVETITGNGETSIVEEHILNPGETYTREITVQGDKDLRVTIVWTDPAAEALNQANQNSPRLINDLDLRVKADGALFPALPWALNEVLVAGAVKTDNSRDNVEDVLISQSAVTPGTYTISVSHKNTLKDNDPQAFSLVVNAVTDELNVSDSQYDKVSVYPNPATDIINIQLGSGIQGVEGSIIMYDLQGRIVREFNSIVDKINVDSLNAGMYILDINYEGYRESKKIMIK